MHDVAVKWQLAAVETAALRKYTWRVASEIDREKALLRAPKRHSKTPLALSRRHTPVARRLEPRTPCATRNRRVQLLRAGAGGDSRSFWIHALLSRSISRFVCRCFWASSASFVAGLGGMRSPRESAVARKFQFERLELARQPFGWRRYGLGL
ncbi:hypothetical protein CCR75_003481 [Bremia lactucae]|uniref:Uncharacterized protein n=1 Tax=Bremia lactucae TaxID=4779 RepID=A0A976IG78_BRELC|nr:hypothetical protein CCR75_003481 [Bremia lactucae]